MGERHLKKKRNICLCTWTGWGREILNQLQYSPGRANTFTRVVTLCYAVRRWFHANNKKNLRKGIAHMRLAIISDIHGECYALDQVVQDIRRRALSR